MAASNLSCWGYSTKKLNLPAKFSGPESCPKLFGTGELVSGDIFLRRFLMADSAQDATPPKSSKSRSSNSPGQIQVTAKSQIRSVPRCTKKIGFFDLVNFRQVAFEVETVLYRLFEDFFPRVREVCVRFPRSPKSSREIQQQRLL